jgi:hypothetical protein
VIVKGSTKLLILCSAWLFLGSCRLFQGKKKNGDWTVYPPLSSLGPEEEVNMNNFDKLRTGLTLLGGLSDSAERADAMFFLDLLDDRYNDYKPIESAIAKLVAAEKSSVLIEVFGGNWCSDTHAGVPELCKVLDVSGFSAYQFEYHRVSRDKMLVDGQSRSFEIGSVPLVRVYRIDSEGQRMLLGEIVEIPRVSWEEDLVAVIGGR